MRQLHLDPEVNEADQRAELRREIRIIASSLGWTPGDLDQFCDELVGATLLLCEKPTLEWLLTNFRAVVRAVVSQ